MLAIVSLATADMMRKSIVFDAKTPKVFYCPQHKPKNMEKLIVRAVPLERLCEFDGQSMPEDRESDCYNDIDETDYACAEKQRIMVSLLIYFAFIFFLFKVINVLFVNFVSLN